MREADERCAVVIRLALRMATTCRIHPVRPAPAAAWRCLALALFRRPVVVEAVVARTACAVVKVRRWLVARTAVRIWVDGRAVCRRSCGHASERGG